MLRYVILGYELGHQATNRNAEGEDVTNRTWEKNLRGYRSRTLTLFLTLIRTIKIKKNKTTPEYRST